MGLEEIVVTGIDHRVPVEIRERVAIKQRDLFDCLSRLKGTEGVREAVILSTCNRTEVYLVAEKEARNWAGDFLIGLSGAEKDELSQNLFTLSGKDAALHLFRVACGLESMVLGEDQILGQVREAWEKALEAGASGKILNRLFSDAVALGKKARFETRISDHPLSISYIAVKFVEDVLGGLSGRTAFVIGAGEMARIAIKYLIQKGIAHVSVSNRTHERALNLKREIPEITVVPYDQKYEKIASSDIVISATDAPHYTVDYDKFKAAYRGGRVCMVDLAVPRDIDPRIGSIPGVSLFTLDDLKMAAVENENQRRKLAAVIEEMAKAALEDYVKWYSCLAVVPVIKQLNKYVEGVCLAEFEKVNGKLPEMGDRERRHIKKALDRVGAKIAARYLSALKFLAENGKIDSDVVAAFQWGDTNG
ncbi:glutamyl-tRNA reductase [Thermosediminibacter oceani]|nr:glutamyl-tRNA reductase [Thermosediminibacter oceani]